MNNKKILISMQDLVLIGVFLLSIFLHTEFSATFLGISLRHMYILLTIPFFVRSMSYKNNLIFAMLLFGQFILFLLPGIFLQDYKVSNVIIFSYLLYCVPFFFDFRFFSQWTERGVKLGFLSALFLLFLWGNFGAFQFWNDNCIAYLYFGGINLYLFIPLFKKEKCDKSKKIEEIIYFLLFLYGVYLLFQTNSRNIVLAEIFVIVPLILKKVFRKKIYYYTIAIFSIIYSALNVWLNMYIQNNSRWFEAILEFSTKYFEKDTVFDGRLMLQRQALKVIAEHPIVGHGYECYSVGLAPHNNFLVMMFTVGIVGTLIYYIFVFWVLKMAYQNFCVGDKISFICALIFMGFMIQLGAESFFIGNNIIVLMPYFFMGVIICRNRSIKNEKNKTFRDMG